MANTNDESTMERLLSELLDTRRTGAAAASEPMSDAAHDLTRQLLKILQAKPSLACQPCPGILNLCPSPLHILLASNVDFDYIRQYCNIDGVGKAVLAPQKSYQDDNRTLGPRNRQMLPIHVACVTSSEETVLFLAQQAPEALIRVDDRGYSPFNYAMSEDRQFPISFDTLKILMNACPESVLHSNTVNRAVQRGCPADFLEDLVALIDQTTPTGEGVNSTFIMTESISMDQARAVVKLLPKLEGVGYTADSWQPSVFSFFLSEITANPSIRSIPLVDLPSLEDKEPHERLVIVDVLQQMLKENCNIESMVMSHSEFHVDSILLWVQAIQRGLMKNKALNTLQLTTSQFEPTSSNLKFSATRYRRQPVVRNSIAGSPSYSWLSDDWYQKTQNASAGKMSQSLYLHPKSLQHDAFATGILHQVLPHLTSRLTSLTLFLTQRKEESQDDLTNVVVYLLTQCSHSFERLRVEGRKVDMVPVCEVLATNEGLKSFYNGHREQVTVADERASRTACLEMLKNHNVTLIECSQGINMGRDHRPKIQHFLDLNRLGRATAREASPAQLIKLILAAWNDELITRRDPLQGSTVDSSKQSMVYGLLREAPTRWF